MLPLVSIWPRLNSKYNKKLTQVHNIKEDRLIKMYPVFKKYLAGTYLQMKRESISLLLHCTVGT